MALMTLVAWGVTLVCKAELRLRLAVFLLADSLLFQPFDLSRTLPHSVGADFRICLLYLGYY